jgi:hypothetical protein
MEPPATAVKVIVRVMAPQTDRYLVEDQYQTAKNVAHSWELPHFLGCPPLLDSNNRLAKNVIPRVSGNRFTDCLSWASSALYVHKSLNQRILYDGYIKH